MISRLMMLLSHILTTMNLWCFGNYSKMIVIDYILLSLGSVVLFYYKKGVKKKDDVKPENGI